ncbi:MAG: MBL fold metallo-hydrolase [Ruminococcaceae bacterium]|nr:MBL fold metallo-hydrolase [Oscillospiraceae bacterium]
MLKFTFLGTCSGTEPMPNRHHSSVLLEINDLYYWFDAGENCSHRAYTSGVDVSHVRAVFISHMHVDHIGGLANLMSVIRKVHRVTGVPQINNNCYDIFVPSLKTLNSVKDVAGIPTAPCKGVNAIEHEISDGVIFEDENIRVTALHNTHLKETGEKGWHAYSFLIEAEGKKVIFSGDVGYVEELDPYTEGGCDMMIMETGHHKVEHVCEYAVNRGVPRLIFTHHGRQILSDVDAARELVATLHSNVQICDDGDVVIV